MHCYKDIMCMCTHVHTHCMCVWALRLLRFILVHPSYPDSNRTNFDKNPTSFSRAMMGCYTTLNVCTLAPAVHARPQTLLINPGDHYLHLQKISWRSDFIWLRYWGVLPGNTFGNTQTDKPTNKRYSNLI